MFFQLKLLLLGAGECGKSTLLKQVRILHKHGYSAHERYEFAYTIRISLAKNLLTMIEAMTRVNMPITEKSARASDLIHVKTYEVSAEMTMLR